MQMADSSSFFLVIDVDREAILKSSTGLLESLVINLVSTKASHSHVSWLISKILVTQFSWALLNNSVVEWFWLIELFSVLGSVLICVSVSLGGPAGAIPKG